MNKFVSPTQLASRLGVSEKTVNRMARDGRLPAPVSIAGKPRYPEDQIEKLLATPTDTEVHTTVTLTTRGGSAIYKIVNAKYQVLHRGDWYAAFELSDGSWHLRPWLTTTIDDLLDYGYIFLSCEDTDVSQKRLVDLPPLASVVWDVPRRSLAR